MSKSPGAAGALRERVEASLLHLNAGDPDFLLSRYAENVGVRVPIYRPGDPLGEPEMRGKPAFRAFLLRYLATHRSYTLRDIHSTSDGMMLSLECAQGDRMTLQVRNNRDGLGEDVTIYVT